MSKLKLLTVNELQGHSDRVGIEFTEPWMSRYSSNTTTTRITVCADGTVSILQGESKNVFPDHIDIHRCDLDTLIEFLQEARIFVSEEAMVAKLIGKNGKP